MHDMLDDLQQFRRELATLRVEQGLLDAQITQDAALHHQELSLQRMRKRQDWLERRIAYLESMLHPDIIA